LIGNWKIWTKSIFYL